MGENGQFHLASAIIKERKYFDISLQEVLRQHSMHRKFEVPAIAETVDPATGELVEVYLVLKVSGRMEFPISWDVALLMHHIRIDGFGYEESWTGPDGVECSGWHRHKWKERQLHAKAKEPVSCFDSVKAFQHFLTTALKEMNIVLSGRDDGSGDLF